VEAVDDPRGPAERLLAGTLDERDLGRPLSERARQSRRSVEDYLKAGGRPRWMERLLEIDRGIARERRRLDRAYQALREQARGEEFAERWRAIAASWRFDALNELISQHNEWYPIERDLPIDLRTRDYVRVGGRSHRRTPLGPEWVLQEFPVRPRVGRPGAPGRPGSDRA
jgi:hypothetical protein